MPPIESATYISDLNASNPLGTDQRSTVDDHLRLVKSTVKATWPNVSAAVTPTHTELNYVDGVTSAIQTQLDAKAALASPTFTGTPLAPTPSAGDSSTKIATTAFVGTATASLFQLTSFTCVVTGSPARDLLFTPATMSLSFRSGTLTSGVPDTATLSSSEVLGLLAGNTLGGAPGAAVRIMVLAINTGSGVKLAVANAAGGLSFDESQKITTLALVGAGNTATAYYSNTAVSNVCYRVLGYVDVSLDSSPYYWTNTPTLVQPTGGQALAQASIGYGQTWQAVTRTSGTTYQNLTGKPITLFYAYYDGSGNGLTLTVDGLSFGTINGAVGQRASFTIIIPHGSTYVITLGAGSTVSAANELR
jgi:hypothetical protein